MGTRPGSTSIFTRAASSPTTCGSKGPARFATSSFPASVSRQRALSFTTRAAAQAYLLVALRTIHRHFGGGPGGRVADRRRGLMDVWQASCTGIVPSLHFAAEWNDAKRDGHAHYVYTISTDAILLSHLRYDFVAPSFPCVSDRTLGR